MKTADIPLTDSIESIGVIILLSACLLNQIGNVRKDDLIRLLMNLMGAGTACVASVLLD